jgi:hypothetical protein
MKKAKQDKINEHFKEQEKEYKLKMERRKLLQ